MEANPSEWSSKRMYHFLTSAVAPRPIAWVTTKSAEGVVNAAPFSWFQTVCADPPTLMIAFANRDDGSLKDTARNILDTGEFVVNAATKAMLAPMVASSAPFAPEESETQKLNLAMGESSVVAPPRIRDAPFHLECRLVDHRRFGEQKGTTVVFGEIVHVSADDQFMDERGSFRTDAAPLLARLGGAQYLATDATFEYRRPS